MTYTAITLADLKVDMAQRYDESIFWTAEEARLAINEALRDWNLLVGRWSRRLTLSTGAGTVHAADFGLRRAGGHPGHRRPGAHHSGLAGDHAPAGRSDQGALGLVPAA